MIEKLYKDVSVEVKKLETKEELLDLARKTASLGDPIFERDLKPGRVEDLRNQITSGEDIVFYWSFAVIKEGGKTKRVDGQHSATAIIQLLSKEENAEIAYPITIVMTYYSVDTAKESTNLFTKFNTSKSVRTKPDIMKPTLALADLVGFSPSVALKVIDGICCWMQLVEGEKRVSEGVRKELLLKKENRDFFVWCCSFLQKENKGFKADTPQMVAKPVIAAMYSTFTDGFSSKNQLDFWKQVATLHRTGEIDRLQLEEFDLRVQLSEFLMHYKFDKNLMDWPNWEKYKKKGGFKTDKPPYEDVFMTCCGTFYAHIAGVPLKTVYHATNKVPLEDCLASVRKKLKVG